jgi:hypothetical protein
MDGMKANVALQHDTSAAKNAPGLSRTTERTALWRVRRCNSRGKSPEYVQLECHLPARKLSVSAAGCTPGTTVAPRHGKRTPGEDMAFWRAHSWEII